MVKRTGILLDDCILIEESHSARMKRRDIYEETKPIPKYFTVSVKCDYRCINPEHFFLESAREKENRFKWKAIWYGRQ